ncbi:3-phytase [Pseudoduganella flava]|uniref:Phytase n=1 Tax=Pseudoduganella flava TaxID=871742 RepID=A0A562PRL3_9BURK|nr:phytase [Pseudoduganella flava]QGZ37883.1 phytase [Pseudoduganella flava]TWI46716.1 3-phytase [Pseudoduganella flava]
MRRALTLILLGAALTAQAQVPATLAHARDLAAIPGGWLALDKHALRLVDAAGSERATIAVRGRQLDVRADGDGALALVVDANAERPIPVRVDAAAGTLTALPALPEPGYGIEAACLYRDAHHLTHVFTVAKDGQADQWLLGAGQSPARHVRHLALPPHAQHCRVDDTTATLYVAEEELGVWAYRADPEGAPLRRPVALAPPFGKMTGGAGALAVLPDGLAATDGKGKLHAWRRAGDTWRAAPVPRIDAGALASGDGLLARTADGWRPVKLAWAAAVKPAAALPIVVPRAQTASVARAGDAADDPAIWLHPHDPAASRILGTDKKQGLLVYDLQGRQTQLLEAGRLNNVDVRQDVAFGTERFDLAMATQRDENAMVLFTIDANGTVSEAARLPTELAEIYGACLYRPKTGGLDAFVNDKDGRYLHYRIDRDGGRFTAKVVRRFRTATQPEGCVADEASGRLFVGEEKRGLWVTSAAAEEEAKLTMALPVGGLLHADVEGVGIYRAGTRSYVVVSSQGNDSYVVLDAAPPYKVRGAFRIGIDAVAGIDGTSETDGLEVTSANLGGPYGRGMLVVQDGYKRMPDGPQNFKLVAWDDIAKALRLD